MTRYSHAGGAVPTTLTNALSDVTLDPFRVDTVLGWPDGSEGPFFIVVDRGLLTEEKMLIASRSGDEFVILERGADDTQQWSHAAGAVVEHVFTALEADAANAHVETVSGDPHGLMGTQEFVDAVDGRVDTKAPATYAAQEAAAGDPAGDPSLATTVHSLPYPDATDDLRVRAALQLLAEALDGKVPIILNGTGAPPEPAGDWPEGTVYLRTGA